MIHVFDATLHLVELLRRLCCPLTKYHFLSYYVVLEFQEKGVKIMVTRPKKSDRFLVCGMHDLATMEGLLLSFM